MIELHRTQDIQQVTDWGKIMIIMTTKLTENVKKRIHLKVTRLFIFKPRPKGLPNKSLPDKLQDLIYL